MSDDIACDSILHRHCIKRSVRAIHPPGIISLMSHTPRKTEGRNKAPNPLLQGHDKGLGVSRR